MEGQMPNLEATWKEASWGGVVYEAGNSVEYITGGWRSFRPIRDMEQCTHCMICWVYCPDSAVLVKDGKVVGFDYDHCKGCGICAQECPVNVKEPHEYTGQMGKVIQMVPETEFEGW
jgi:pyruvate ferredoxin oxidoreductase delta subunit